MSRVLLNLPSGWDSLKWATDPRAVCADSPVDYWFPERGQGRIEREGARLCFTCPIRKACLEHALRRPEKVGTWGGTTANQRGRLYRPLYEHGESIERIMSLTLASAHKRGILSEEEA